MKINLSRTLKIIVFILYRYVCTAFGCRRILFGAIVCSVQAYNELTEVRKICIGAYSFTWTPHFGTDLVAYTTHPESYAFSEVDEKFGSPKNPSPPGFEPRNIERGSQAS